MSDIQAVSEKHMVTKNSLFQIVRGNFDQTKCWSLGRMGERWESGDTVQTPNPKNKKRSTNEKWDQESETRKKYHEVETHHLKFIGEIYIRNSRQHGPKCPSIHMHGSRQKLQQQTPTNNQTVNM